MVKRRPRSRAKRRPAPPKDVALILQPTEDNEGFQVLRRRGPDGPVELGTMRPLREGRPLDGAGEVVSLRPRQELPFLYDVKVELAETRRPTNAGPPQVAALRSRNGIAKGTMVVRS